MMNLTKSIEGCINKGTRSHSAQGLASYCTSSPAMKIPLPPRLWITGAFDTKVFFSLGNSRSVTWGYSGDYCA